MSILSLSLTRSTHEAPFHHFTVKCSAILLMLKTLGVCVCVRDAQFQIMQQTFHLFQYRHTHTRRDCQHNISMRHMFVLVASRINKKQSTTQFQCDSGKCALILGEISIFSRFSFLFLFTFSRHSWILIGKDTKKSLLLLRFDQTNVFYKF